MLNSKLIIVAGMSGVGKSTTSKNLAKQYELNELNHKWLHEEIGHHPIRHDEFTYGDPYSEEDMDHNVQLMYDKWQMLVNEIVGSDSVYIMEGCYYQAIIRYFLDCHYPIEKIINYYDQIMTIMKPLNPTIVYLYRKDIRASFEEAFQIRGERWQKIILEPEYEGYFKHHEYTGNDSIYSMWQHYQDISHAMFERYQGYKMKIETSGHLWEDYMRELTHYLGLYYYSVKENELPENLEPYCGIYSVEIDGEKREIEIKCLDGHLYAEVFFWSNMTLIPLDSHTFEVQSFPITFVFDLDKEQMTVTGEYGWSFSGKTLCKVK